MVGYAVDVFFNFVETLVAAFARTRTEPLARRAVAQSASCRRDGKTCGRFATMRFVMSYTLAGRQGARLYRRVAHRVATDSITHWDDRPTHAHWSANVLCESCEVKLRASTASRS